MKSTMVKLPKQPTQSKMWALEECPACNSKDISTDYYTGEVFCLKCGLVIY